MSETIEEKIEVSQDGPTILLLITALLFLSIIFLVYFNRLKQTKIMKTSNNQGKTKLINTIAAGQQMSRVASVNYHFTRFCNYKCKFCFHTAKSSFVLPEETAKIGLKLLKDSGMRKINFSGGEPFTKPQFLGNLVKFCKVDLALESVTIVSNGSLITEKWFEQFGKYLDIIAISCDSFDEKVLAAIGRGCPRKDHLQQLYQIRDWCRKYKVMFKINTVVTSKQHEEDMNKFIKDLAPARWKVFQCLLIGGENAGKDALRDASEFVITKEQFDGFIMRHKENNPIPESNEDMKDSYIMLDERMRFLNCQNGEKIPSNSILDVGVEDALDHAGFDQTAFFRRGGKYDWSKDLSQLDW